jgi:hypothetical protein
VGSRAYTLAGTLHYGPGELILEVGTDRGEGSTGYLASLGVPLITIDIDADRLHDLGEQANVRKVHGRAEELLADWDWDAVEAPIRFAWLDGHDWPYDGQDGNEAEFYRRQYEARGQLYNRPASRDSHLAIAQAIADYVPTGGVIAIDDTWRRHNGSFDGKGGSAVPWLLAERGFSLHALWPDMVAVTR